MRQRASQQVRASLGKFRLVVAFPLVKGHFTVHYTCCTRMAFRLGVRDSSSITKDAGVVLACSAVERGDQVAVGGAGCGDFVVAVLEVLAAVEELLFEFGDAFPEGAGFVGAGEAGVVEDLFAEDFGQPLGELGVLVAEAFVVFTEIGEVGQQRPSADAGAGRVRFGFGGESEDLAAQVVVAIQERAIDAAVRATAETVISSPLVRSRSRASISRVSNPAWDVSTVRSGGAKTLGQDA